MKVLVKTIVMILTLASGGVMASPDFVEPPLPPAFPAPPPPPMTFERIAVGNILQEQLAQLAGRSIDDIKTLMKQVPPNQLAEELGLDEETFKEQLTLARQTFLLNALNAGLITDEQRQQLSELPLMPIHHREIIHRSPQK